MPEKSPAAPAWPTPRSCRRPDRGRRCDRRPGAAAAIGEGDAERRGEREPRLRIAAGRAAPDDGAQGLHRGGRQHARHHQPSALGGVDHFAHGRFRHGRRHDQHIRQFARGGANGRGDVAVTAAELTLAWRRRRQSRGGGCRRLAARSHSRRAGGRARSPTAADIAATSAVVGADDDQAVAVAGRAHVAGMTLKSDRVGTRRRRLIIRRCPDRR